RRVVAIPARFTSAEAYKSTLVSALVEEINLRLAEPVQQFYGVVRRLLNAVPPANSSNTNNNSSFGGWSGGGAPHKQQHQSHQHFSNRQAPNQHGRPGQQAGAASAANPGGAFARLPAPAKAAE
ncbi:hypothetical protein Agub_g10113, partial [Astrephomene gubernaculifera]